MAEIKTINGHTLKDETARKWYIHRVIVMDTDVTFRLHIPVFITRNNTAITTLTEIAEYFGNAVFLSVGNEIGTNPMGVSIYTDQIGVGSTLYTATQISISDTVVEVTI